MRKHVSAFCYKPVGDFLLYLHGVRQADSARGAADRRVPGLCRSGCLGLAGLPAVQNRIEGDLSGLWQGA
jgi:hypothetical protein